jgi:hypothetical protein
LICYLEISHLGLDSGEKKGQLPSWAAISLSLTFWRIRPNQAVWIHDLSSGSSAVSELRGSQRWLSSAFTCWAVLVISWEQIWTLSPRLFPCLIWKQFARRFGRLTCRRRSG